MLHRSRRPVRRTGGLVLTACALLAPLAIAVPASASSSANEVVHAQDSNGDGVYEIVLRDLESGRLSVVVAADPVRRWLVDDPELSPNGSRVAYSTDFRTDGVVLAEGIAVRNRDGSGYRRLTSPPSSTDPARPSSIDIGPAWSPDGLTLLFTRITTGPTSSTNALYTVPAAGGTAVAVPGGAGGYLGDWSPDGTRIVFTSLPDRVDPDGSGPLRVPATPDSGPLLTVSSGSRTALGPTGTMPSWSPDGATIAYSTVTVRDDPSRREDVAQIATVPATGGSQRVLAVTRPTAARTVAQYPSWAPDSESLVFDLFGYSATRAYPPGDLWAVDARGRRAGRLTTGPGDEAQGSPQGPAPTAVSAGAASTFTPVTPRRVLDTRRGTGAPAGKLGAGGTLSLAVRGLATDQGRVPDTATAVVLNLTVTQPTLRTDIRAYPSGTPVPRASSLNAGPSQTVPNHVTVRIGDDGAVTLRNTAGTVHVIADLAGYYTPGDGGLQFAAVDPGRVLDTRAPSVGTTAGQVGPGRSVDLRVTGTLPTVGGRTVTVPPEARAVVLNVTATRATAPTVVRVYPTPTSASVPDISNLNVVTGVTSANLVTVAVGVGGKVRLHNDVGQVDLLADLAGYYAPGAGGRFVPVTPTRFLDTRAAVGAAPTPTTAGGFVDLEVAGTRGVPTGATAAVLNLLGTTVSATTDIRAYPFGAPGVPTVSNLNLTPGATRANQVVVRIGAEGRVRLRNTAGQVNLIGDLAGYMVG